MKYRRTAHELALKNDAKIINNSEYILKTQVKGISVFDRKSTIYILDLYRELCNNNSTILKQNNNFKDPTHTQDFYNTNLIYLYNALCMHASGVIHTALKKSEGQNKLDIQLLSNELITVLNSNYLDEKVIKAYDVFETDKNKVMQNNRYESFPAFATIDEESDGKYNNMLPKVVKCLCYKLLMVLHKYPQSLSCSSIKVNLYILLYVLGDTASLKDISKRIKVMEVLQQEYFNGYKKNKEMALLLNYFYEVKSYDIYYILRELVTPMIKKHTNLDTLISPNLNKLEEDVNLFIFVVELKELLSCYVYNEVINKHILIFKKIEAVDTNIVRYYSEMGDKYYDEDLYEDVGYLIKIPVALRLREHYPVMVLNNDTFKVDNHPCLQESFTFSLYRFNAYHHHSFSTRYDYPTSLVCFNDQNRESLERATNIKDYYNVYYLILNNLRDSKNINMADVYGKHGLFLVEDDEGKDTCKNSGSAYVSFLKGNMYSMLALSTYRYKNEGIYSSLFSLLDFLYKMDTSIIRWSGLYENHRFVNGYNKLDFILQKINYYILEDTARDYSNKYYLNNGFISLIDIVLSILDFLKEDEDDIETFKDKLSFFKRSMSTEFTKRIYSSEYYIEKPDEISVHGDFNDTDNQLLTKIQDRLFALTEILPFVLTHKKEDYYR